MNIESESLKKIKEHSLSLEKDLEKQIENLQQCSQTKDMESIAGEFEKIRKEFAKLKVVAKVPNLKQLTDFVTRYEQADKNNIKKETLVQLE